MKLYYSIIVAIFARHATSIPPDPLTDRKELFWNNCGSPSCVASVTNVSLSPSFPKTRQPLTVISEIVVSEEVSSGEIIIEVWDEGERILYENMTLCDFLPCPITPGIHTIPYKLTCFYPGGEYTGSLTARNDRSQLMCVEFKLKIYS